VLLAGTNNVGTQPRGEETIAEIARGMKPVLLELLGPPAATDQAPPPTGDPRAR